jgi:hypothetical protein
MTTVRCVQCNRTIRTFDESKVEFLHLKPDGRTEDGTVEVWIHKKKCLALYNAGEDIPQTELCTCATDQSDGSTLDEDGHLPDCRVRRKE